MAYPHDWQDRTIAQTTPTPLLPLCRLVPLNSVLEQVCGPASSGGAGQLSWDEARAWGVPSGAEQRANWPVQMLRGITPERHPGGEDVAWAADLIPFLRPQGWEAAPTGTELERAILDAYRASPWHPDPMQAARTLRPHARLTAV